MKHYTMAEQRYLRDNWRRYTDAELAAHLGRTPGSIKGARVRYGFVGKDSTRFEKGLTPWNKGKDFQPGGRSVETRFQPGDLPKNTRQDGDISPRRDTKSGITYLYIRVALGKWVLLQRHVWQQEHGAIPTGMVVVFRDGNTQNCTLENLELITRSELLARNENRKKMAASLRATYQKERIRKKYGLPLMTGHGHRITNY